MGNVTELRLEGQAVSFGEAFPFGNGSFGGMDYGSFPDEKISLNRDTLWSGDGSITEKEIPEADLIKVRRFIEEGSLYKAQEYIKDHMLGKYTESYLPLGTLHIRFEESGEWATERCLDMKQALIMVRHWKTDKKTDKKIEIKTEIFASGPDDCIVVKISGTELLSLSVSVESQLHGEIRETEKGLIYMGNAPSHVEPVYIKSNYPVEYNPKKKGMAFALGAVLNVQGENVSYREQTLYTGPVKEAVIKLCCMDGYLGYGKKPETNPIEMYRKVQKRMEEIKKHSFDELFRRHRKDYGALFDRFVFSLGEKGESEARYLQYARYLMLSSSRPGGQPANLQGIWNEELRPAWCSNYTLNINTEMNYWMTHHMNLEECFEPFIRLVGEMSRQGRVTAARQFHCKGWAACHNTDLWRYTSPVGGHPRFAYWPMGGIWMTCQLYDHFLFTQDQEFARQILYPVMKGAVEFIKDWLVEGKDGKLHTCPSTSPENTFLDEEGRECAVTYSSAMDIALIRELLTRFHSLPEREALYEDSEKLLKRLPEYRIGKDGCLQEWYEDYEEADLGHRHFSPLYGFFPGTGINEKETPELTKAAKALLEKRISHRNNHIGWSSAWLINLYARFGDGEKACDYLNCFLQESSYPNLLALHPPLGEDAEGEKEVFQIDGNFGAAEGMVSMLIQEKNGEILVLPALPKAWPDGFLRGIRLSRRIEAALCWERGKLKNLEITAEQTVSITVRYTSNMCATCREQVIKQNRQENGALSFLVEDGQKYFIRCI